MYNWNGSAQHVAMVLKARISIIKQNVENFKPNLEPEKEQVEFSAL